MSEAEIRRQIQHAVAEARRRAYEMAGGYADYDDMDGGKRGRKKGQKYAPRGHFKLDSAHMRDLFSQKSNRTHWKSKKLIQLKRLGRASKRSYVAGESPVLYNPRYRHYVVYLEENGMFVPVARMNNKGKRVFRKFTGSPAAAARKAIRALTSARKADTHGYSGFENLHATESSPLHVKLIEVTQGVRKRRAGKTLKRTAKNPLRAYFVYEYYGWGEDLSRPKSYTVHGKNGAKVVTASRKFVVARAKMNESAGSAIARREVKARKAANSALANRGRKSRVGNLIEL